MATIAEWLKLNEGHLVPVLQEAAGRLESAEGEVVLDFSSVRRIDANALQAMEEFAHKADEKAVKVVVRSVNVDVYKVLKLVKLASRFSFVA
jgi:anti-anti-sigma regulatory factor